MDSMKGALGSRAMTVKSARQCAKERKEWGALVHMLMIECDAVIFVWFLCFFDHPPALDGL